MNPLDQIKTLADWRAICRDNNWDEDEPTAKERIATLRELQASEAHPRNRVRLWANAQRMIDLVDNGLFALLVLAGMWQAAQIGWKIGCVFLGGDPRL